MSSRDQGSRDDVAVAVHPGLVDTQLARSWLTGADVMGRAGQQFVAPVARALAPWLLIRPEKAVESLLYAATAPSQQVGSSIFTSFFHTISTHMVSVTRDRNDVILRSTGFVKPIS